MSMLNNSSKDTNIIITILMFILLHIFNLIKPIATKLINEKINKQISNTIESVNITPQVKGHIEFIRIYGKESVQYEVVDAIIDFLSKNNKVKKLLYIDNYTFNSNGVVQITDDLSVSLLQVERQNQMIEFLRFEIFSHTLELTEIRGWIKGVQEAYEYEKRNGFADKQYYFNQVNNPRNNKSITFEQCNFYTNKSLSKLYGKYIRMTRERLDTFLNNPSWYIEKGLPHSFGLLLHGPPGCGKTSLIKAIANETKRHIFNIRLTKSTTATQFRSLFLSEKIYYQKDEAVLSVDIPIEKRILIFEDCDSLTDVLLSRKFKQKISEEEKHQREILGEERYKQQEESQDKLTLADVLNIMDGVLEQPGRIVIFTTNHPEKLDEAFIRPGRIDMNIHFTNCDAETLKEMFEAFYGEVFPFDFERYDKLFSPALIQEQFLRFAFEPQKAYDELSQELLIINALNKQRDDQISLENERNRLKEIALEEKKRKIEAEVEVKAITHDDMWRLR